MEKLVVTESRTKAERIQKIMSRNGMETDILWTNGSIAESSYENGKFVVSPSVFSMDIVSGLVRSSSGREVYIVTDYDREGEFIALACTRFLEQSGISSFRSDLRTMSETDCLSVFDSVRELDLPMAYSAILRRMFDINIGRHYSRKATDALGFNCPVGRIQVPLVACLEGGVRNFGGRVYPARTADILAGLSDRNYELEDISDRMQAAYENGKVSYIRTDSCAVPDDVLRKFAAKIGFPLVSMDEPEYKFEQKAHSAIYTFEYGQNEDVISKTADDFLLRSSRKEEYRTDYRNHTEAGLVRFMQEDGIARPSTYVSSIGAIQRNGFAARSGKVLSITEKGEKLLRFVRSEYPFLEKATYYMEKALSRLEAGQASMKETFNELGDISGKLDIYIGGR